MGEIASSFAARGRAQLDLRVVAENVAAVRFYAALGFPPAPAA